MGPNLLFTTLLLASGVLILLIALYAWKYRTVPLAVHLAWLLTATAFYAVGYAFELASTTLPGMLFWSRFQYVGIPFIQTFWLLFVSAFTGYKRWLTKPVRGALFGVSGVTLFFHWTQSFHRFYYVNPRLDTEGAFPLLAFDKGLWYWVFQIYANAALLFCVVLLVGMIRRSSASQRRQVAIMLSGSVLPWIFYLVYVTGFGPRDVDLTPFGLALATPLFAWGVFRSKILDAAPIAHDSVFMSIRDGVVVVDTAGRIVDLNPAAELIFPLLSRGSIGRALAEAIPDHPEIVAFLRAGASPEVEVKVELGEMRRHYVARQAPILTRRGHSIGHSIVLRDMTQQNLLKEKLQIQATIDDLTGACIRRYFLELGRRELVRSKRYGHALSMLILDLDKFKRVNDTWGHEAGDQVLQKAAETLRMGLRDSDVLGRHGGEEFAILLPETPPARAVEVADRLRRMLAQTEVTRPDGTPVGFTASFGIAGVDVVGDEDLADLVRAADRAMYVAKEEGRNCVRCSPALQAGRI